MDEQSPFIHPSQLSLVEENTKEDLYTVFKDEDGVWKVLLTSTGHLTLSEAEDIANTRNNTHKDTLNL